MESVMGKHQWKKKSACLALVLGMVLLSGCSAVRKTVGRIQEETGIELFQPEKTGQSGISSIDVLADEREINSKEEPDVI